MIKSILISLLLILLLYLTPCQLDFPFQRKLWSFWDNPDLTTAPLIVRACYQKLLKSAQKAGFEYTLLNSNSIRTYIPNYDQKITKVRQHSHQPAIQHFADLIRFHIIYEHGGIWLDLTTYVFNDFDWLLNITSPKYKHLITNRFSPQPDILLFYSPDYQNAAEYFITSPKNQSQMIYYNEHPGYEIWFLAAKKHNVLMKQIAEAYSEFTQLSYWDLMRRFEREDIFMVNEDGSSYLSGNMAISYVVQKAQFQLDREVELFGKQRVNVYERYRLWSVNSLLGPLSWVNWEELLQPEMMQQPFSYFEQKGFLFHFFIKLSGDLTKQFTGYLSSLQWLNTQRNLTFSQFLETHPTLQQCQYFFFLVNNSLLAQIFSGPESLLLSQSGIEVITPQQKNTFRTYCSAAYGDKVSKQYSLWLKIKTFFFLDYPYVQAWFKVHEVEEYSLGMDGLGEDGLGERVNKYLWQSKGHVKHLVRYFADLVGVYLLYVMVCKLYLQYIKRKTGDKTLTLRIQSTPLKTSTLSLILHSLLLLTTLTLCAFTYYSIDLFGFRDQPLTIIVTLIITFGLQTYIQSVIEKKQAESEGFLCLAMFYQGLELFLAYWSVYMVFCNMMKNKEGLQFCTTVVGLLGTVVVGFARKISVNGNIDNIIIRKAVFCSKNYIFKLNAITTLILLQLIPNSLYYTTSQTYLICYLPYLSCLPIFILFASLFKYTLARNLPLETFRLTLLALLILFIYIMIPYKALYTILNRKRVVWNMMCCAMFGIINVQLGSSLGKKHKKKLGLKGFLKYFGVFFLAWTASSFVWVTGINNADLSLTELAVIMVNSLLISLHLKFSDSEQNNQKYQSKQSLSFQQVQMEISEQ